MILNSIESIKIYDIQKNYENLPGKSNKNFLIKIGTNK
jgi:hypothetical protein